MLGFFSVCCQVVTNAEWQVLAVRVGEHILDFTWPYLVLVSELFS